MGSVKYKETSVAGDICNIVEYEFSDSTDFFAFDEYRQERLNNALKSFIGGLDSMDSINYPDEPITGEIKVTKKTTKH